MTKFEYRETRRRHRQLSKLLKLAYTFRDRQVRIMAVANLQTALATLEETYNV